MFNVAKCIYTLLILTKQNIWDGLDPENCSARDFLLTHLVKTRTLENSTFKNCFNHNKWKSFEIINDH